MISSAVVIPEEPQSSNGTSDQPTSLKRRQSSASISSESNKRPRLNAPVSGDPTISSPPPSRIDGSSAIGNGAEVSSPPPQPGPGRRKSSQTLEQDKSRNRRLFGALLGTLSQSSRPTKSATASAASARNSRREEIENRQRERLKRENEEVAQLARRKKEELDRIRRSEQVRWDEEGMNIRHRNLRASAGFLRTNVEPRMYYKPWELRENEEATIKSQIEEAEETIRRELEDFKAKQARGHPQRPRESTIPDTRRDRDTEKNDDQAPQTDNVQEGQDDGGSDNHTASSSNEQQPAPEQDPSRPPEDGQTRVSETNAEQDAEDTAPRPVSKDRDDDHGGEELEQGQEDDVIY